MAAEPGGRYLYVGHQRHDFAVRSVAGGGAEGTLTPMTPASVPSGPEPLKIVTSP